MTKNKTVSHLKTIRVESEHDDRNYAARALHKVKRSRSTEFRLSLKLKNERDEFNASGTIGISSFFPMTAALLVQPAELLACTTVSE